MLLNNEQVNNELKEEINRYLGTNKIENTMTQYLWNTAKAILRRKVTGIQAYVKK